MKIFVLLSRIPYPIEKGDKLRAFHQIRCLSKHHEIILCALSHAAPHPQALSVLKSYCSEVHFIRLGKPAVVWNLIKAFLTGKPLQTGYFYSSRAQKQIDRLLAAAKPDHIFCQLVRVTEYVKNSAIAKTLDYQDVFSMGMKRRAEKAPFWSKPLFLLEYRLLLRYENRIFDSFDHRIIISEPDRALIPHSRRGEIQVIPNGVDHEYFAPQQKPKKYDIVFTGNMGYPPNVDAAGFLAGDIMPLVWKNVPGATLLIAGATPHPKVQALAGAGVTVSGWMPDIRDAYAESRVFIAPMRIGTGLQNKLLEAMSMELPCITTPMANQALNADPGRQILVGKSAGELAGHITKLLLDSDYATELASSGLQFVRKIFNWDETAVSLSQLMASGSEKTANN